MRGQRSGANISVARIWPCADGFVSFGLRGGKSRAANMQTITRLVDQDGLATPALTERDWSLYDHNVLTAEELEAIAEPVAAYFARHSMAELYETAVATNLMLAPANSPRAHRQSSAGGARYFGRGRHRSLPCVLPAGHESAVPVARPGATSALSPNTPSMKSTPDWTARRPPCLARPERTGHGRARIINSARNGGAHRRALLRRARRRSSASSPAHAQTSRTYGQRPENPCGLDGSDMFDAVNVGKLGVTLNLKHPEGVGLARRLISGPAVAENFAA
jgi:crotonobetainyl-CoA:carnitine CoA-transferase CaiB-like acyl-CoA transferase